MSIISDFFKKPKDTVITQEAMLTDQQKKAMEALLGFGMTGNLNGFQAGEAYKGSLGDFTQTPTEALSGNRLFNLLQSNLPQGLTDAGSILKTIATTGVDANSPLFQSFKTDALRQAGDSADILNRDAASMGNYFSSGALKEKGLLAERTQQDLTSKLAQLYDSAQNRALSAANSLADVGVAGENIEQDRIQSGFNLGSLQRLLNTANAQSQYAEFQRQRSERMASIDSLNTVYNKQVQYGVPSVTLEGGNSPFRNMIGNLLGSVGGKIGDIAGGKITDLFGGGGGTGGSGGGASGILKLLGTAASFIPGIGPVVGGGMNILGSLL